MFPFQISGKAPLAPELALKEQQHAEKRENQIKKDLSSGKKSKKEKEKTTKIISSVNISDDPVHNDFKREILFYRQAQSAVLEALPRLKSMNIPTKRPDDYFAQMAKTDEHMQKVSWATAQDNLDQSHNDCLQPNVHHRVIVANFRHSHQQTVVVKKFNAMLGNSLSI